MDPLSDGARRHLLATPLRADERLVLAIVAEQVARLGARAFKYSTHERIEAAGVGVERRKQIIRLLVDRGAIKGGWHNVGARSDPDLMAIYVVSSAEAVSLLLEGGVRPGRRQRPSSLAESLAERSAA